VIDGTTPAASAKRCAPRCPCPRAPPSSLSSPPSSRPARSRSPSPPRSSPTRHPRPPRLLHPAPRQRHRGSVWNRSVRRRSASHQAAISTTLRSTGGPSGARGGRARARRTEPRGPRARGRCRRSGAGASSVRQASRASSLMEDPHFMDTWQFGITLCVNVVNFRRRHKEHR
jgi:hypothetical protein